MLKDLPNRVIYMAASTLKNKYKELKKKMPSVAHFQPNPTSLSWSKDMLVLDCLNIGLV